MQSANIKTKYKDINVRVKANQKTTSHDWKLFITKSLVLHKYNTWYIKDLVKNSGTSKN